MRAATSALLRCTMAGAFSAALAACSSDDPTAGTIEVTIYGEAYIEDTIPPTVFADGWTVTFDKFLISLGDVSAEAGHDVDPVGDVAYRVFDLAQPSPDGAGYVVATLAAPGGTYDHFGYVIGPSATATAGNASAEDTDALKAAGQALRVVGVATRGEVTIQLDWGFTTTTVHSHCEVADDVDGGTVTIQATIHGDHLFYDDAVSSEPGVAFQTIADADGADGSTADGTVTLDELAAVDLAGLEAYQVGSLDIDDLRAFVAHQATTVGHVNGEGHCEAVAAE